MGKKLSMGKARAMRDGDSRKWTAADMLEDLLEQVKTGVICPKQIAIHWFEDVPGQVDAIGRHDYLVSKCSIPDHVLLLQVGQAKMMDILRGD